MKKNLFAFLFVFAAAYHAASQVFLGSGYASAEFFGVSSPDAGSGFIFQIEKDFDLSASERLRMHPNINISFLYSEYDRPSLLPSQYLNVISLSPKVSYEILSTERWKIAPFANPFVSVLLGLESGSFFSDTETINRFKSGIEGGLRFDFMIGNTTFRLIPISFQRSLEDFYRQGMISLMVGI
ncbi:MAG: hypothetical protein OXH57_12875 [Ekhidna sp.]|nr:hypothetical protein [Ekhidna sp.]